MTFSRRDFARSGALAALVAALPGAPLPLRAAVPAIRRFPQGLLWGAATSSHQSEGDNTASDIWWLEHVKPTSFAEPSGSAVGSFGHWRDDLDLVQSLGLNTYRFSLEWSRIEPEEGQFSPGLLETAAASLASPTFSAGFLLSREQFRPMIPILAEAHRKGRAAIKSVRPICRWG